MTEMIWRPAARNGGWNPNRADVGIILPSSGVVEIVVAVNISGDVLRGLGIVFALIAFLAPIFKVIEGWSLLSVFGQLIGAGESILLAFG